MQDQGGFTLIETLIVLFILSIIASVVLPELSSSNPARLDSASNEVATALRFARDESIRTGQVHGVHLDTVTTRLYAFKAGTGANPLTGLLVDYHPHSKQPYDFLLSDNSSTKGVGFSSVIPLFHYYTLASSVSYVLFDEEGTPFWRDSVSGNSFILESANIDMSYGDLIQQVVLEPGFGRVLTP